MEKDGDKNEHLTNKQKKNLAEIEKYAQMARLHSIEGAIIVERIISNILLNYLSNEKSKESLEKYLFYDTLSFDQKINLFNSLNKAGAFNDDGYNKELNSDLVKIKNIRNFMAHSMLHTSFDILENFNGIEIKFKSYTSRNMISDITFRIYNNEDDVDNLIFSINGVILRYKRVFSWLNKFPIK
mgnify:CR=1 FL=1|tara:strand:+ start:28 stop:579 length:552 start_codon:yes stop_codon:yes gene_type:complete